MKARNFYKYQFVITLNLLRFLFYICKKIESF